MPGEPGKMLKSAAVGLKAKAVAIIQILHENPFKTPLTFVKLVGDLAGASSRRINIHHRLIYQVMNDEKVVKIIRLWTHNE
jgi:toxin YoeB